MKPFVLIATRPEDEAADAEHAAFLRFSGLCEDQLLRVRLEAAPLPPIDLQGISGVIVGGSPFNTSDAPGSKSERQRRVESDLAGLLDRVIAEDVPFLGACYGVGTLGVHQGATVDTTHAEPVGAITVELTDAGRTDPLVRAADLPERFRAFVGHKEAVSRLPAHATLLARGAVAPVQMFRIGTRQYATQFHPELDADGLIQRIHIYRDAGYFAPEEMDELITRARGEQVDAPRRLLEAFVELFAR